MKCSAKDQALILKAAGVVVTGSVNPGKLPQASGPPASPGGIVLPLATVHGGNRWAFEVDGWHPTTLNRLMGSHHMEGARLKRSDAEILAGSCLIAGVTRAIGKRRVGMTICLGPGQRAADPDAYFKSALDGLVRSGAIRDDSRQWIEWTMPTFVRRDVQATAFVIEDVK